MTGYPLLRHRDLAAPIAFQRGERISAGRFLDEAADLAERLPGCGHVLNLCRDRYRFTVGFAAALMRGQVSLLPSGEAPGQAIELAELYPDLYCLWDGEGPPPRLRAIRYPEPPERQGFRSGEPPVFPAGQPAAVLFTSGSTGRPQPSARSWGGLVESSRSAGARLGIAALSGAALLGTVPHQHSYGLESTVLLALQHGLALSAERPLFPGDVAAGLAALPRPRALVTTPVHLRALVEDEAALPPADLLICATAPLSPQLAAAAEARFGAPLHEIYGCSEAGQIALRRTVETAEWRCLDGMGLRQDERGTWVACPAGDAEVLLNDVIELTGPDRFLLHGRTADLVNIAGKRNSLAHLNFHLNSIKGVHDGVFLSPDDRAGAVTRLIALVVAPGISPEAIRAALRQRIDAAFLPRPLYLVDALPRNELGKLPREALLRLAAAAVPR